ncbi:translational activator of GCN4 [Elasticomyces elasticus]|nr:translational activator of GCN4 [Elasticomyces elasticus]
MAEVKMNGTHNIDMRALHEVLLGSATTQRTHELHSLNQKLSQDFPKDQVPKVLHLIVATYPLYVDSKSRLAVEDCLNTLLYGPDAVETCAMLIDSLEVEAAKTSIAPANALVLIRWCSLILQHCARSQQLWNSWGTRIVLAQARSLETLISFEPRESMKNAALTVSRKGFRRLFSSPNHGIDALNSAVSVLTAKSPTTVATHAVLLGVLAGVCKRLQDVKPALEARKKDYLSFYLREIIGSRTVLPPHIATSLHDFFISFVTIDDLEAEIVPALEKALLRAPEVVLNDLVSPMILSLDPSYDLSNVLANHLLKPLMSNIKSSNTLIRGGALHTFEVIAPRCTDESLTDKICEELLNPLKQSKVPVADQRVAHAQMLAALNRTLPLSNKIPAALAPVAIKEANELAIAALTRAISVHLVVGLSSGVLGLAVSDAFNKGLSEKRLPARRLWALRFGEVLWELADVNNSEVLAFVDTGIGKLVDTFNEVCANPVLALQHGQIAAASVLVTVTLGKLCNVDSLKSASTIRKASVAERVLAMEPKPSFLLNARVYTKLTAEDDLTWVLRALSATISHPRLQDNIATAWSQAILYLISGAEVPMKTRKQTLSTLRRLYAQDPARVAKIVTQGLWQWCEDIATSNRDSTAVAAKTGTLGLDKAVRCICIPKDDRGSPLLAPDTVQIDTQLVDLLVLCRSKLIPRTRWIELCLSVGLDPGDLVRRNAESCLQQILRTTEIPTYVSLPAFQSAAYSAAADLTFVAPSVMTPMIVAQIQKDLDPQQLGAVGSTEIAIFHTPEGTAFVDVLAKQIAKQPPSKNTKDFNTLKWEEELRAQLAQKKGQAKKLTADEQSKVNAQLRKEASIREEVRAIDAKLRRGIGIVRGLSIGPPSESEEWFAPAVDLLLKIIDAGAGLIVGDAAALVYLQCADRISPRLGALRRFVGVATLRAAGTSALPQDLEEEPLGDLVTRILYRLKFMGEQRCFDTITLTYVLPLIFLVIEKGAISRSTEEEVDEQVVLALEFLATHADTCSSPSLPRVKLLSVIISSMQRYTQHFKLIKDCLSDMCRSIAPTATEEELAVLLQGCIVPQVNVRTSVLQAINAELDLTERDFWVEIWLACHDDGEENIDLARGIWDENDLHNDPSSATQILPFLESTDKQLRRAAAKALAESVNEQPDIFEDVVSQLQSKYKEKAKPRVPERDEYGMPMKTDLTDLWEARSGIALALTELAPHYKSDKVVALIRFLTEDGPLGDRNPIVRDEMVEAATAVITMRGQHQVEELMQLFESSLEAPDTGSPSHDQVNEAVVILYGALARHLEPGDSRVSKVVQRLLETLSTPSESVQYAVAGCLPPLVQASAQEANRYVQQLMEEMLHSKRYAARRGAAYGLAGVVKGKGIAALRENRIMTTLQGAIENKKDQNPRQGAFCAYELLSLILGRVFEPYVIQIVPQLLAGFGDTSAEVREACLDAAKTCFATLSSFGVQQILPTLLEGLKEQQWRSKKGACDSLGAMAYLDPQQLAISLPDIIPPLTEVLNDSHKEVRLSANRSLQRFGEVISNPEIKSQVNILLKALSDPTKYTDDALDALIKVNFIHYLDAPSLALVVRILERGLGDRSATKRKASQVIGSLAHLTERKDLIAHLPILVAGLRVAIVDPVPTTRATASKALGSTIEKLGEDALPDLIPSLMSTLKSDTGAGDRLGSAQALSEVLAGLGTGRLEETLPTILQNVSSSKPSVREGFMSLFIFLPVCFGNSFANYLSKIIPPILSGLADDVESIRETALRAGRLLVKNFATRAIDLLLPELERGLADDSYRIRLSSVELVGDLLFNLTGISGKTEADEVEEGANEAGQSLLEVLGEEKRNKVLSALYICRCDTSGLVRTAAVNVWKALVATPRTLRELIPTLTQLLIRRLASSNMEQKVIAGNALGELIRKAGEGVLASLLPTLEEGLQTSTDSDTKQGICIALRELVASASPDSLDEYEKTLISVVRTALVDSDADVREAAAEAFDSLQKIFGKKAIDQVLPYLLNQLRTEGEAENALQALLTLLTEQTRSNVILPNLLPTLLTPPITAFNARAIASLAEVASTAMTRRLPTVFNAFMDTIVATKDPGLKEELGTSFDAVLLSVDEFDGLNAAMSVMLALAKHDDHRKRASADMHLGKFFQSAEVDFSRYYPDLIRALLVAFDDRDAGVVRAAWTALSALTQRLRKEEMESLVVSTRQTLNHVGVAGHDLPGFSLPKGINAILPIFLQGLMNGSAEQRTQAALAISDMIDRTSPDGLKPFVTQITGPLIRVVSERSVEVKAAILLTLNNLLEKIPTLLKPFLPQLQRTFAKSLADTTSETLRSRAAKALGTLITLTPRIDPLIAELVTGSKTSDIGVRNAMLKALYEVVSKAGGNMSEASRNAVLGLIDSDVSDADDSMTITNARLLGALIKVLPPNAASSLIKTRVLTTHFTHASVLALNSALLESPQSLTENYADQLPTVLCKGIVHSSPFIADNCVLAAGKYLLTGSSNKSFETTKPLFEALAQVILPGSPVDTRRLALVVIRTVSRKDDGLVRGHLGLLAPPIFASVRDSVIPVKLSAEAAFLAIFSVVDDEDEVFNNYMAGPGSSLPPGQARSMQDYFKRVAMRLGTQARERKEAEGGQGGLGLASDEREDEREVWSVGKVDLGEGSFRDD